MNIIEKLLNSCRVIPFSAIFAFATGIIVAVIIKLIITRSVDIFMIAAFASYGVAVGAMIYEKYGNQKNFDKLFDKIKAIFFTKNGGE